MEFTKGNNIGDVTEYTCLISNDELDKILASLFREFTPDKNISQFVLDVLINEYLKSFVVNDFIKNVKVLKGVIYKIKLVTATEEKIIMLSHSEQANEIFY